MRAPSLCLCLRLCLFAFAVPACAGRAQEGPGASAPKAASTSAKPPAFITPGRLFALPGATTASYTQVEPDGTRRLIVSGMRVVEHPNGSLERGEQVFSATQTVNALEMPPRLGGGFLFYSVSGSSTSVWRAKEWVGDLAPLARVDAEVEAIVPGFDRVYLVDRRSADIIALDVEDGRAVDMGSLPPAVSYGSIAVLDDWQAAVEVPFQGILATFDAGASWSQLPVHPTYGVSVGPQGLLMATARGSLVLGADGRLAPEVRATTQQSNASGTEPDALPPPSPLGRLPLQNAVLHGFPDSADSALVVHRGAIGRVRLRDGEVLDVRERVILDAANCHGVALGKGAGFVCGEERGRTTVYAFEAPLGLRQVMEFDRPRYVGPGGTGALVVRGPCARDGDPEDGGYCVVDRELRRREIRMQGDVGVERAIALADGRVAVVVPPRLGADGALTIVARDGSATSRPLKLPKAEPSTLALLKKGLWLDGMVERLPKAKAKAKSKSKAEAKPKPKSAKKTADAEAKGSVIAGWVVAAGPFVGVRVALDGTVTVGKVENDIGQTLMSGPLAVVFGRGGRGAETTDGGFVWREMLHPTTVTAVAAEQARGCSRIGCAFAGWLRVGYSGSGDDDARAEVEVPKPTALPGAGGGRWQLRCGATGQFVDGSAKWRAPAVAVRPPRRPPSVDTVEFESSQWHGFMGEAPPTLAPTDVGFDFGVEHSSARVRGYVWGARGASWERVGSMQFRAFDDMELTGGVWSTAVTRAPFPDAAAAAQTFGQDSNLPVSWSGTFDSLGRAGAVLVNARGALDLFLLEENRAVAVVKDVAQSGLYQLGGVAKLGSTWYVAGQQGYNALQLFKVTGNSLSLVRLFPLRHGSRTFGNITSALVRTTRGDGLGVFVQARRTRGIATSWYLYPLDADTGEAGTPIELAPDRLAQVPPPCTESASGYVVNAAPPVDPYLDFIEGADSLRQRSVTARIIVNAGGMCVDSLAAEAETPSTMRLAAASGGWTAGKPTWPLVLHDRDRTGSRWGFRCAP